jgi:hypothetical protein
MSRRTSVETSQPPAPHPVLAAALGCMDVQLEAELARYRRQRAEQEESSPPSSQPQIIAYPAARNEAGSFAIALPTLSAIGETQDTAAPIIPPELQTEQPQPVGTVPSEPEMGLIPQPSEPQPEPDDYLESSERLLRNLERGNSQPETAPSPNLGQRLLTPLGLGSMLLLLLAGTMIGAALIDPSIAGRLGVDRWFKSGTTTATGDRTEPPSPTSDRPNPPKLDTDEFVELDLDNLSTIAPSSSSLPGTPSSSTGSAAPPTGAPVILPEGIPGTPSNLTRALIPPTTPLPGTQTQAAPAPQPSAITSPAAPAKVQAAPAPTPGDRFYYVLVNNSDASSLQQAQKIVPDAYLRDFDSGARIQMGAFLRAGDAQRLTKQLQEQGISASVYHR